VYTIEQCLRGGKRGDEMLGLAIDPSADPRFEPQKTELWSERLPRATAGGSGKGRRGAAEAGVGAELMQRL
jgi:hypothetical protein